MASGMTIDEIHDKAKREATLTVLARYSGETGDPRDRYCRIIGVLINHLDKDEELVRAIEAAFSGLKEKAGG